MRERLDRGRELGRVLRSVYLWGGIVSLTSTMYILGLPVFLLTWPFDRTKHFGHRYATIWGRTILWLNNRWRVDVRHTERIPKDRALVIVSNHQGMGDIMMAYHLGTHFKWISKRSNFFVPFMGWFMFHAGYIPLERRNKKSIARALEASRDYLKKGVSILMFPEGTRTRTGEILPFKPGAFQLAIETGCDVLPVAMSGTMNALPNDTWLYSDEYNTLQMNVGEPISVAGMGPDDVNRLMEMSRDAVVALKAELDSRPPDSTTTR